VAHLTGIGLLTCGSFRVMRHSAAEPASPGRSAIDSAMACNECAGEVAHPRPYLAVGASSQAAIDSAISCHPSWAMSQWVRPGNSWSTVTAGEAA